MTPEGCASPPGLPRIRTFSYQARRQFGSSVGKIPLDVGLPCPNRRRGGCIFCRPAGFTPHYLRISGDLSRQVAAGKTAFLHGRFTKYYAYFQQETCTAVPADRLLPLLGEALADAACVGLILSTRPDMVEEELLAPLAELVTESGRECLFELGVQSAHERSLALLNRNHGFADFCRAAEKILAAGVFQLGAHLIFGIPGESEEDMLASLAAVCRRGVGHLKLHHLQVIRGTPLEDLYRRGRVPLFTREGYLDFLLRALPEIPAQVVIHRLWATAHPDLLVAPRWQVLAGQLSCELQERMASLGLWQGQRAGGGSEIGRRTGRGGQAELW